VNFLAHEEKDKYNKIFVELLDKFIKSTQMKVDKGINAVFILKDQIFIRAL
jgi:hypothetical protein